MSLVCLIMENMDLPERKAVVVIPMACKARIEGVLLDIVSNYVGLLY